MKTDVSLVIHTNDVKEAFEIREQLFKLLQREVDWEINIERIPEKESAIPRKG